MPVRVSWTKTLGGTRRLQPTSVTLLRMAFGKPTGPPASHSQMQALLTLLQTAGHDDFRDARGPMGFSQRQAGGKFTADEAQAFIDQLEQAEHEGTPVVATRQVKKRSKVAESLEAVPTEVLAAELQSRGWVVLEP